MLTRSIHAVHVAAVVNGTSAYYINGNNLTFSLFKIVRDESKQFSIVHLHKIFKKSNLNNAKLITISSYINVPNDL